MFKSSIQKLMLVGEYVVIGQGNVIVYSTVRLSSVDDIRKYVNN